MEWLIETTGRMVRCRSVVSLVDLAYAAIREGLGFDRVGLLTVDHTQRTLVERVGTDNQGCKFYPQGRAYPLDGGAHQVRLLVDPRLGPKGPGFVHQTDAARDLPPEAMRSLDGSPPEVLRVGLRTADTIFGLISVDNLISQRPIGRSDIQALVAFANSLVVALENVALLEERARRIDSLDADLRRHVADLEWLREISRRVNAATELDEVLDIVYDGIRGGLGYDRVGIVLFDRDRELFEERRGTDEHGNKMCPTDRVLSLAPDSSVWEAPEMVALLAGAEFYYTPDLYAETPPEQRYLLDGEPKHNLNVPLRSGDKLTGQISVDNLISGRPFYPEDAGPLVALANQVATAIEKARLLERERAERARLAVLLESARALNSTLDFDHILQELASRLLSALGASVVHFSHVDRQTRAIGALATHATPEYAAAHQLGTRSSADSYPKLARIFERLRAYRQSVDDAGCPAEEAEFLRRNHLQAELLVPLVVQGEVMGVLEVYWSDAVAIGADAVELSVAIAEQAAVAMENARLYAEAAARAQCDALTGLLNHRAFLDRVDSLAASGQTFALLLIDVDDFKLFNDTHGHLVGDAVLAQIAGSLQEVCREGDTAGRYGGDEFALLLRGLSGEDAAKVKRRLDRAIRTGPYMQADGALLPLSVSIGIACSPHDGQSRQELLAVADAAMYASKRMNGGRHSLAREVQASALSTVITFEAADLLGDSPLGVLEGLVAAVDAKDRYTREHSDDVTRLALLLADALGLAEDQRRVLALAGSLHDVGKVAVPDRILRKPGRLTAEEYDLVKRHVLYGVALIRAVLEDDDVVEAVAHHHERWDGCGYPTGLPGHQTPLLGRIMQLADAVSAMMLDRPYRRGLDWGRVVAELRTNAGTQFDPSLVEGFIAALGPTRCRAESA